MDGNRIKILTGLLLVTAQTAIGGREFLILPGYVLFVMGIAGLEREEGRTSPWAHGAMAGLVILAGLHGILEERMTTAVGAVLLLLEIVCLRYALVLLQKRHMSQEFETAYLLIMCAAALGMGLSSAFGAEMFSLSETAACFAGRGLAVWALCSWRERG